MSDPILAPPRQRIVMADPGCHLGDLYQMVYDDEEDQFHFLRLACDHNKPIIPLDVDEIVGSGIARTYGLKPFGSGAIR